MADRPTPLSVDDVRPIRAEFPDWLTFIEVVADDPHKVASLAHELLMTIELLHEDLAAARGDARWRASAYMGLRRAIEKSGAVVDVPPLAGYLKGGK